jgi:hypothetical protein
MVDITKFSLIVAHPPALQTLYNLGARKIAVASLGPIGCCPFQLTLAFKLNGVCDDKANTDALYFNQGLLQVVNELNAQLPGAHFTYLDVYKAVGEIVAQPQLYGTILTCFRI